MDYNYFSTFTLIFHYVLTTGTKNTRSRLTRLIVNLLILGWTLCFFVGRILWTSPHVRCSRLLFQLSASRLLTRLDASRLLTLLGSSRLLTLLGSSRLLLSTDGGVYLQVAPMPKSETI